MRVLDGMLEFYALPLDLINQGVFLFMERLPQLVFKVRNLAENVTDFFIHDASLLTRFVAMQCATATG